MLIFDDKYVVNSRFLSKNVISFPELNYAAYGTCIILLELYMIAKILQQFDGFKNLTIFVFSLNIFLLSSTTLAHIIFTPKPDPTNKLFLYLELTSLIYFVILKLILIFVSCLFIKIKKEKIWIIFFRKKIKILLLLIFIKATFIVIEIIFGLVLSTLKNKMNGSAFLILLFLLVEAILNMVSMVILWIVENKELVYKMDSYASKRELEEYQVNVKDESLFAETVLI